MTDTDTPGDGPAVNPSADEIAAAVRAELCGPGGRWELAIEEVLGERHAVFVGRHRSVRDMFVADTARHGDHVFLVLNDQRLTYADVAKRVASTATRLQDEFGVGPGDRVAILAANRPEWVLTFFATVSLGAIVVALNGWWTADELDHALALTGPRVLIGDARRLARVDTVPTQTSVVDMDARADLFEPSGVAMPDLAIDEDDPALILFTSGTTGRSKGATLSHRGLIGFVDGTTQNADEKKLVVLRQMGIDPATVPAAREITLNTSPLFHISGLLAGVLMQLRIGSVVIFREGRFDPADVLRIIEAERVTSWSAIGAMAPMVLDHPDLATTDVSSIIRLGSGGAHLPQHLQERIRERFPQAAPSIGQGYGSSESAGVVTTIGGQLFRDHPDSTGAPSLGFEVEIRDDEGNVCPDGVEGEVHVRSAWTMLGYWGNPEASAETIKAGRWLAMGDIGRIEDGLLYLNSRARDMILRAAENIYPVEIEHRLEAHPDVAEAAVIGVDHLVLGQEVKAIIVPTGEPSSGPFDPEALTAWCGETLAGYKVPSLWERRDLPLPRNASGKVVKAVLTGDRKLSGHDD